jgi:hypothetical protein
MPVQPAAWRASWPPLGHKHQDLSSVHIKSGSGKHTLGLKELVNLSSCETSNQLFSEFVLPISPYPMSWSKTYVLGLSILFTMVLVSFHSFKSSSSTIHISVD